MNPRTLSRCSILLIASVVMMAEEGGVSTPPVAPAPPSGEEIRDGASAKPVADPWMVRLFDKSGKLDKVAYAREGRDCGAQAINRRLGPDYDSYHKGAKASPFPDVYMPPTKSTPSGRNGKGFSYQVGGPYDKAFDNIFGATGGQVFYVPDKPGDPGIDRIETFSWAGNCMVIKPEHVWWGGAHPEPAVLRQDWLAAAGGTLGAPYNMGRNQKVWCNDALMIFNTGFIGAVGNQTSDDKFATFRFPPHKIPTAVAVTTWNEFALVTIWDTKEGKGQVAVLALEALGLSFHSWIYIGMPNGGSFSRIKLLGYVDLPGISTPTDICASGNHTGNFLEGNKMLSTARLDDQTMRDSLYKGNNKQMISSAGYAVVISRHESKVAFLDLQPLFEYFRQMYLTTPENFAKTKDSGPDPKQWPYDFSVDSRGKPVVVKVINQPNPTAVLGCLIAQGNPAHVYVASRDGRIGIYRIGGLATDAPATPDEITLVGGVQAGRNPTQMKFLRAGDPLVPGSSPWEMNLTFAVCCRGDREIDFIHVKGTDAEIYRRIRDSRLQDPVAMDFCERTFLVSVADFKGRKVVNYRIGPISETKFFPGTDGKGDFECGGFMEFPGFVYNVNTSNVN